MSTHLLKKLKYVSLQTKNSGLDIDSDMEKTKLDNVKEIPETVKELSTYHLFILGFAYNFTRI